MRTVIPYTKRNPRVVEAAPPDAEWHDVRSDPHAYWRLMRDLWSDGESVLIIEHDVICTPEVLLQVEECPCWWATFGYQDICHPECQLAWRNQLGCTRFSSHLIEACPDAVSSIPEELRGWTNLCDHIAGDKVMGTDAPLRPGSLRSEGFSEHWHHPAVEHLHGGRDA